MPSWLKSALPSALNKRHPEEKKKISGRRVIEMVVTPNDCQPGEIAKRYRRHGNLRLQLPK